MLEQIVAQRRVIISQMRVYYLSRLFLSLHLRFEDEVKLIKGLLQSELGEFIPRASIILTLIVVNRLKC